MLTEAHTVGRVRTPGEGVPRAQAQDPCLCSGPAFLQDAVWLPDSCSASLGSIFSLWETKGVNTMVSRVPSRSDAPCSWTSPCKRPCGRSFKDSDGKGHRQPVRDKVVSRLPPFVPPRGFQWQSLPSVPRPVLLAVMWTPSSRCEEMA